MSLDAGSVYATLGGKVDASAFAKFGSLVDGAANNATKAEGRITSAWSRQRESAKRLGAEMQVATTLVENHSMQQRKSALAIEAAQAKAAAAEKKYGAESLQARQATLEVAAAQQRHAQGSRDLQIAQTKLSDTQREHTNATRRGAASLTALGGAAKTGALVGLAALAAGTVYSVRKSMDLQKALAEVQAVTRAGPQTMAKYKQAAIELGTSTGVGATEAAGALAELAKGGLSVDDTLTALQGTIALAQAGGMDLATAGQTVAQSLNLFNMKGSEATKVADSFANAANATTADVSFFAQGMAQGGAAAKAAGLNFDETTVALEMMAANGFKSGSDAGTSLKTTLTQIAHPTKQAAAEAKRLGLEFFDSKGKIKGVADIAGMLGDKMGGLTKRQRLAAAATIAGTDGMRALLALYDQGAGKAEKFAAANSKTGTAARTAAGKTNNLEGNLQKLQAQFDALAISAGDTLVPALTDGTKALTTFMNQMRDGKGDGGDFAKTMSGIGEGIKKSFDLVSDSGHMFDTLFSGMQNLGTNLGTAIGKDMGKALRDAVTGETEKVKPKASNTQMQNLDNAAVMAKAGGVSEFKVNAVLYNDGPVRERIAGIKALAAGVSLAKVQAVMSGDQPVRVRLAALTALAHHVPNALVQAILTGDGSVKLKLAALNASTKVPPAVIEAILDGDQSVKVKLAALKAIASGMPVADVMAILNGDASVKRKLQAINALAGSMDDAKTDIFAFDNATPVINSALTALQNADGQSASMTITTYYEQQGYSPLTKNPPGKATGRGPGASERALVGEGGGPEWIGNPADGFYRADRAMLADLRPQDAVIPTEPRYAGNAIGFLRQMYGAEAARVAHEMGVSGYAKGKSAVKLYAAHDLTYYENKVRDLETSGKKYKHGNKAGHLVPKAQKAVDDAKKLRDKVKKYASKIETATGEADIDADHMTAASNRHDQGAYNVAFMQRRQHLKTAIDAITAAIPKWEDGKGRQQLRKELSGLQTEYGIDPDVVTDPATTYTPAEQTRLDELNRAIAEAELTDTTTDDVTALQGKETWLSGILQSAIQKPSARGGDNAVTQIAGELKSTRDSLVQLTKAPDVTSDMQAQLDQANERTRIANESAKNNAAVLAAFTGSGDIGAGGRNAYRAAGGVTVNFQSYVPPSPQEARRLADYTVGGIGYQGAPPSPRQVV